MIYYPPLTEQGSGSVVRGWREGGERVEMGRRRVEGGLR